ncbi:MAG: hypothetical protein KIT65_10865 [Xanthobacteraceae bacterium]|nr:hypothetical protein [Xanthobacteraceae bacterium]
MKTHIEIERKAKWARHRAKKKPSAKAWDRAHRWRRIAILERATRTGASYSITLELNGRLFAIDVDSASTTTA